MNAAADGHMDGIASVATYAVLGDPVAHSLSPTIHNAAFKAAGRSARYVARRVSAQECGPVLRALALKGGGGNVTVPHKERVLPFLDRRSPAVSATGACNTFWAADGRVCGDNTDVEGFLGTWDAAVAGLTARGETLASTESGEMPVRQGTPQRKQQGCSPEEQRRRRVPDGMHRQSNAARGFRHGLLGGALEALVLGAGGAARAVLFALLQAPRVSRVLLWNRTPGRAAALALEFGNDRVSPVQACRGFSVDVVVNATSAGLRGRRSPLDFTALSEAPQQVIDLVYGEGPTPLCRQARELGIPAVDGREMLVRQAEAAYFRWFGEHPPTGVMSRALGQQDP